MDGRPGRPSGASVVEAFVVLSVFLRPVFLFSYSTVSNSLDQKPMARGAGGQSRARGRGLAWPGSAEPTAATRQLWSVGLAPTICWCHCQVLRQQDRVLQVVFYPSDRKTNSYNRETLWFQAYKHLCHHVDFIQDSPLAPVLGTSFC